MKIKILLLILIVALLGGAVWGIVHFRIARRNIRVGAVNQSLAVTSAMGPDAWAQAVERVKADRNGEGAGAVEIPSELKHYDDRHWFLATQVAEVAKYNVESCQDYVELAAMIRRGEMVPVPAVTETYVLFGVGARADDNAFVKYSDDKTVEIYNETRLSEKYRSLEEKRATLQAQIDSSKHQSSNDKTSVHAHAVDARHRTSKSARKKNSKSRSAADSKSRKTDARKAPSPNVGRGTSQLQSLQLELQSIDDDKALLDEFYGQADSREKLFSEYESLRILATNFNGRSFNIDEPQDRLAFKMNMLSSIRPEALKILEEVASTYHNEFNRPLPVSSLVRPEQYQHALRRVNRNAVLIETPPHSTGLAFDIDYRYMSAAEQTFVMDQLARLKREGRIEVIRERNANYHVFAFLKGSRPSDDLIAASLEKAGAPVEEVENHANGKPMNEKTQSARERAPKAVVTRSPKHRR